MISTNAKSNTSSSHASLSEELWRNGHVLIRGAANGLLLSTHRRSIADALARASTERRSLEDRDTYGKAFLQVTNLWNKDDAVKRFVFEKRFAQIAADLLIAEQTVKQHRGRVMEKMGVRSVAGLVRACEAAGLLSNQPPSP